MLAFANAAGPAYNSSNCVIQSNTSFGNANYGSFFSDYDKLAANQT